MLDSSLVTRLLERTRKHADAIGLRIQFETCLAYVAALAERGGAICLLFPYPAPHSFAFAMERPKKNARMSRSLEGCILYYCPHDDAGAGAYPTLSVTVLPSMGWSIFI